MDENDDVVREPTELEKEFEAATDSARAEIREHLKAATDSIRKAIAVSEKYGIPFNCCPSFLDNSYIPESFAVKYGELDSEFVGSVTDVWSQYYPDGGWEHSDVC